ncbi:programmed cell death protein 2-like isoform 5-T5 [Clarias gariepinus]
MSVSLFVWTLYLVYLIHITSASFVAGSLVMSFRYTAPLRFLCITAPLMCLPALLLSVTASWEDWCDDADDWGMDSEKNVGSGQTGTAQSEIGNFTESLDVSTRLQELCISRSAGVKDAESPTDIPTFQSFYISVVEETDLVGQKDLEHANKLLKEYEEREGVAVGEIACSESEGREEAYEKSNAKHGDAVFSSFMKRISLCPEQVLRYSWSGTPLFIMEPPSNVNQMVPPCAQCGSPRVFEFQLMPALVSLLRSARLSLELAVEFGTVMIYTCRDSCWTSGSSSPIEEFYIVQTDPDQKLFK